MNIYDARRESDLEVVANEATGFAGSGFLGSVQIMNFHEMVDSGGIIEHASMFGYGCENKALPASSLGPCLS